MIAYEIKLNTGRVKQYVEAVTKVFGAITFMAVAGIGLPGVIGGATGIIADGLR